MSKLYYFAVIVALAVTPFHASALSVATVDMQRIMSESKAAKNAKSQLDAKQKSYQEDANKKQAKLEENSKELSRQRSLLSTDAFKEKLASFNKQAADMQRDEQGKRFAYRRGFEKSIVTIQKKVTEIIATIAQERNLDLVLTEAQALYRNPSFDITSDVLGQLDSQMPSIRLEFKK